MLAAPLSPWCCLPLGAPVTVLVVAIVLEVAVLVALVERYPSWRWWRNREVCRRLVR